MSEPSSSVPDETANVQVQPERSGQAESVELDLDREKLDAWDEVKSDYEVEPGGEPVPNSMDQAPVSEACKRESGGGEEHEGADTSDAKSDETDTPAVSDSSGPEDAVASEEDAERQDEAE